MGKHGAVTCADCYFRRAGLCALALERPCPTFRRATGGTLSPPRQAPLVWREPLASAPHAAVA